MRKEGFSSILIALGLLATVMAFGITIYVSKKLLLKKNNLTLNQEQKIQKETDVGEERIKMLPGQTNISLPSGALLTFGHTGNSESVPDFVYGDRYILNNIHNINYLPIKKKLTTFHEGYKYYITNEGCNKRQRLDIDVMITEVTDCTLKVITSKDLAPTTNFINFSKQFSIVEKGKSIRGLQSNPTEPLLYLNVDPIRVQKNIANKIYIEPGTEWNIYIVTNYGIGTIRYTAEELWNKQTRTVQIDSQNVRISIDNLFCKNLNIKNTCPYFTQIDFTVTLENPKQKEIPIKIFEYL